MMNNIDLKKLSDAVDNYAFSSVPSNADGSAPCTNSDLTKVVQNTAKLFAAFIEEIENSTI